MIFLSFMMKGVDVNMAAYMAELAYLANPMSSHVQAAEMHNQSVNSMVLASARMSEDAVDVFMKMCACHIYAVCQALDLRALHLEFYQESHRDNRQSYSKAVFGWHDISRFSSSSGHFRSTYRSLLVFDRETGP